MVSSEYCVYCHILDVSSALGDPIEPIPFALKQALLETSVQNKHVIMRPKKYTIFLSSHFQGHFLNGIFCSPSNFGELTCFLQLGMSLKIHFLSFHHALLTLSCGGAAN